MGKGSFLIITLLIMAVFAFIQKSQPKHAGTAGCKHLLKKQTLTSEEVSGAIV